VTYLLVLREVMLVEGQNLQVDVQGQDLQQELAEVERVDVPWDF